MSQKSAKHINICKRIDSCKVLWLLLTDLIIVKCLIEFPLRKVHTRYFIFPLNGLISAMSVKLGIPPTMERASPVSSPDVLTNDLNGFEDNTTVGRKFCCSNNILY